MTTINLSKREETSKRYDANRIINDLIAKTFKESIDCFKGYEEDIPIITRKKIKQEDVYFDVPYGENTLGKAGCAVFCFEEGLRLRGIEVNLTYLANEIASKGYYFYGKGTYHNLFDHYGLRRVSDVSEICDSLKIGKLVTILIKNREYLYGVSLEGSHFVNIVGKKGKNFIVDDPHVGRVEVDIENIFQVARVAWVW